MQARQGPGANFGRRILQLLDLLGEPGRVVQAAIDGSQGRVDQLFALRPQFGPVGQIGEGGRVELVDQGRPLAVIELRIEEFLQEPLGQLRPAGLEQQLRRAEDVRRRGRVRGQQCRNHGVFRRGKVVRFAGSPRLIGPSRLARGRFGRGRFGRGRRAGFPVSLRPALRRDLVPTRSTKSTSLRPMPSRRKAIFGECGS